MPLKPAATLGVAALGWLAIRAMTWFLFARYGTEPLLAVIARRPLRSDRVAGAGAASPCARWRGGGERQDDFRRELEWLHAKGEQLVEYVALPVLQLVAAALNFGTMLVASRLVFHLPFRTMKEVTETREILATFQLTPRKQPTASMPARRAVVVIPEGRGPLPEALGGRLRAAGLVSRPVRGPGWYHRARPPQRARRPP